MLPTEVDTLCLLYVRSAGNGQRRTSPRPASPICWVSPCARLLRSAMYNTCELSEFARMQPTSVCTTYCTRGQTVQDCAPKSTDYKASSARPRRTVATRRSRSVSKRYLAMLVIYLADIRHSDVLLGVIACRSVRPSQPRHAPMHGRARFPIAVAMFWWDRPKARP